MVMPLLYRIEIPCRNRKLQTKRQGSTFTSITKLPMYYSNSYHENNSGVVSQVGNPRFGWIGLNAKNYKCESNKMLH